MSRRLVLFGLVLLVAGCGGKHAQPPPAKPCGDSGLNSDSAARAECGYHVVRSIGSRPLATHRPAAPALCAARSEVVFYAASDWLSLAGALARHADPCADYLISIPPLQAKDGTWTEPRRGETALIRKLGPNFHALDEVRVDAWQPWLAAHPGKTWFEAGVEARRRMAGAGFDVARGETWAVNELMLSIASDATVRRQMADFVRGLANGLPRHANGLVFHVTPLQNGDGLDAYKQQVESWLTDGPFWRTMNENVDVWADEVYVDASSCCVPGSTLDRRVANINVYLQHLLLLARAAPGAGAAARAFLERAYVPLGNAAWQWSFGFGNTAVASNQMGRLVSEQALAMRLFSQGRPNEAAQRRIGFAWAPRPRATETSGAFVTETGTVLDRLVRAITDSAGTGKAAAACGPRGQFCRCSVRGARFGFDWSGWARW